RSDDAGRDPFVDRARAVARVALVAHLRDELLVGERRLPEDARLAHRPGERLLDVDVLARVHRRLGDDGVQVIGRGDDDAVDPLLLVEHLAKVEVLLRGVELLFELYGIGIDALVAARTQLGDAVLRREVHVDVAHGHELLRRGESVCVHRALPAEPDAGEVHGVTRRLVARAAEHVPRNDHGNVLRHDGARGELAGIGDEVATRDGFVVFAHSLLVRWIEGGWFPAPSLL